MKLIRTPDHLLSSDLRTVLKEVTNKLPDPETYKDMRIRLTGEYRTDTTVMPSLICFEFQKQRYMDGKGNIFEKWVRVVHT